MATRAPFQVLVLPFRRTSVGFEFALMRRADAGYWQGVAGGGDDGESPLQAARREAAEEASIDARAKFYQLQTTFSVERKYFPEATWPAECAVVPSFTFAAEVTGDALSLSHEHTEFAWFSFQPAYDLLFWHGNKTALWELHYRLKRRLLSSTEA